MLIGELAARRNEYQDSPCAYTRNRMGENSCRSTSANRAAPPGG